MNCRRRRLALPPPARRQRERSRAAGEQHRARGECQRVHTRRRGRPLPVLGGWMPAPPAPPAGLVAVGDGGTGVSVGATVGSGVLVAGTVAVKVGVAERTMRTGVHVGTAKSGSACGAEVKTCGIGVALHGTTGIAEARRAGNATPTSEIPIKTAAVPSTSRSVRSTASPPSSFILNSRRA